MSAVSAPFRDRIQNTRVALAIVVAVVGVAAFGNRTAGYLAALSSGAWFNFFFTEPYQRFAIDARTDVETFVLLIVVGVAGIQAAADSSATGGSAQELIRQVAARLVGTLHLETARYQPGVAGVGGPARLRRDGQVVWKCRVGDDLPAGTEIELLVENAGGCTVGICCVPRAARVAPPRRRMRGGPASTSATTSRASARRWPAEKA